MKQVFPGPGAYEPIHELVCPQGIIVGLKKDKKMKDFVNSIPGPGNYEIKRELGGNKFRYCFFFIVLKKISSFGGLLKKPKPNIYLEPGPGHYDIPGTIGYIPKYLITRTNKQATTTLPNYFDFKNF